ncbi:transcriptional regulator [Liquorilactobacillus ghanensis DSM 18630]|uniref:Transcriptional regulator n=1 Tax=Liquorilactobacillus ghanensis DSM 18630 TaxID=1423750 RepID=A0A0R1VHN3_9LACO|nr:TetR/AcrR family transcriptional regulator [Liquorilactobacillus ghanensis]KRM05280.1 transcriptional regulator [Liquorilactobacillus ghanensis DSM 18630]
MNGQERLAMQSRTWLLEALFTLMQQQNYNEITVKEIAEQAQLSRRTFYRSFKSKDLLLDYYADQLIKKYIAQLQSLEISKMNFEQVLIVFFEFWWPEREKIRILINQNLFIFFLSRMSPQASNLYRDFKAPWHIEGSATEIEYIMSFSVGGFWNILNTWLAKKQPEEPQIMVQTLLKGLNKISQH